MSDNQPDKPQANSITFTPRQTAEVTNLYKSNATAIAKSLSAAMSKNIGISDRIMNLRSIMLPIFSEVLLPSQDILNSIMLNFAKTVELGSSIENRHLHRFLFKKNLLALWSALEEELKTKNRYFPNSEFLQLFDICTKKADYKYHKRYPLYRARKINMKQMPTEVKQMIEKASNDIVSYDRYMGFDKAEDIWDYLTSLELDEWQENYFKPFPLENSNFWGFNADESDAPKESSSNGRANPIGISYLYTAKDEQTAIAEIQLTIGQIVSVAKIKTQKTLRLFSFDFLEAFKDSDLLSLTLKEIDEQLRVSYFQLEIFYETMSELFSRPMAGNTDGYYATQYVSEYIKSLHFDGIKFKSSLKKGGINIVLFDISRNTDDKPINYEVISSSLHKINNVNVSSKKVMPR